jgi:hypothetical protein
VVGPRKPEYLEPQASLGIGSKGIVPLGLRRMSARPILVRLGPADAEIGIVFVVGRAHA